MGWMWDMFLGYDGDYEVETHLPKEHILGVMRLKDSISDVSFLSDDMCV